MSFTPSLAETILVSVFARLTGLLVFRQPSRSSLAFPTEMPALWTNACAVAQAHDHKASESWVASLNGRSGSVKFVHGPSQVCVDQGLSWLARRL